MVRTSEVPLGLRAAAVAYRFDLGMKLSDISSRLSIHKNTLQSLLERVQQRVQSKDIHEILADESHISNGPRPGRPRLVEPGSAQSFAVREAVRYHKYHPFTTAANMASHRPVLKDLDVNIPRLRPPQVYHIVQDPIHYAADPIDSQPVKRKREIVKPGDYSADKRLRYTDEMEQLVKDRAIIVFCDEKKYGFGGTATNHVSLPRGEKSYGHSTYQRFVKEQWAAACAQDLSITRPHIVWTPQDKDIYRLKDQLDEHNRQQKQIVDDKRWRSQNDPQSVEFATLRQRNNEIDANNKHNREQRYTGYQQRMTPVRLYKYDELKSTSDGIDFVWYGLYIYKDHLFPYIKTLRENNPGRQVVIVEDNSPIHLKARKLVDSLIQQLDIEFAEHPPFSPDLNPIETLHREQDTLLKTFILSVRSKAKAVQLQAEAKMRDIWQSKAFDRYVAKYCSLEAFEDLRIKVIKAEGHNTFQDQ